MLPGIIPSYGGPLIMQLTYKRQWLGERNVLARAHGPSFRDGSVVALPVHVDTMDEIALLMADVADASGQFQLCRTRQHIEKATSRGAIGILLAPSHAALDTRPERIYAFHALGAVMFPLSLNMRNPLADGCGERKASGLSHLGVETIRMLNRVGIIADVSHLSEPAFWDVLEVSKYPVMASHSGARSLCDNPRNLTDEQARAIASNGGCVGVSVHPALLGTETPTVSSYIDHIMHFLQVMGEDHVMLGADFIDYQIDFMLPKLKPSARLGIYHDRHVAVEGLSGFANLSSIPDLLRQKGVGEIAIQKICSGNFLCLLEATGNGH